MTYRNHDQILERMKPYGCVLKNGLSNHTPMVVEALAAMDADEGAANWFSKNESTILPKPAPRKPIEGDNWQAQLSDQNRFSDWAEFFEREISQIGWQKCIKRWVPRLTEGYISAACHGVIRVGHAVRALKLAETDARKRELAYAFASWTVSYMTLPSTSPKSGEFNGLEILNNLPLLSDELRNNEGSITRAIGQLQHAPQILAACEQLELNSADLDLCKIARVAANVFLDDAHSTLGAIVFTHGITGTAACLHLGEFLSEPETRTLAFQAFQAVAALHAVYAETTLTTATLEAVHLPTTKELKDNAIRHGDDHVIKLTEACLLFYRLTDDDLFRATAARGQALIPPS